MVGKSRQPEFGTAVLWHSISKEIRRASASIGANIAEGCASASDAVFARHVEVTLGSSSEPEYHLLLSADLQMLQPEPHTELESRVQEVKRMLTDLLKRLQTNTG